MLDWSCIVISTEFALNRCLRDIKACGVFQRHWLTHWTVHSLEENDVEFLSLQLTFFYRIETKRVQPRAACYHGTSYRIHHAFPCRPSYPMSNTLTLLDTAVARCFFPLSTERSGTRCSYGIVGILLHIHFSSFSCLGYGSNWSVSLQSLKHPHIHAWVIRAALAGGTLFQTPGHPDTRKHNTTCFKHGIIDLERNLPMTALTWNRRVPISMSLTHIRK